MDTPREWLEVSGPTVDVAVAAAISELGLETPDQVKVEVIQEGKRGVLGLGGREAIVKVSPLPKKRRRRRRRGGSSSDGSDQGQSSSGESRRQSSGQRDKPKQPAGGGRGGGGQNQRKPSEGGRSSGDRGGRNRDANRRGQGQQRNGRGQGSKRPADRGSRSDAAKKENATKEEPMPTADISEQADVAREFLEGLLDAFGLEGDVTTRIDEDILYLDVAGEQTEALVGTRGAIMTSVLEITRTVVQRKTFGAPRMRLDISGYGERRRAALTIYAGKLAAQVTEQSNEVMLEPMNPADRKVVHDAVADIDGVRSFSEGEDPNRAVVIAPD